MTTAEDMHLHDAALRFWLCQHVLHYPGRSQLSSESRLYPDGLYPGPICAF